MTITEIKRLRNPNQPVGRWIRVDKRLAIYLRDRFTCCYCGKDLHGVADPRKIQLDHYKTKSKGGNNSERNVFTACERCNCSRQDKSVLEFAGHDAVSRVVGRLHTDLAPFRQLAKAILSGQIDKTVACRQVRQEV